MANAPVNPSPVNPDAYPQWGIRLDAAGTGGNVREAASAAAKMTDMQAGYLDWFPTLALARNALSSQTSAAGSGGQSTLQAVKSDNPLAPLFQASLWIRVAEVVLGLVLIAVGVAKLTNAVPLATKVARLAA